jgi:hypothetical protein
MLGGLSFLAAALYWPGTISPSETPRFALLALIPFLLRGFQVTAAHAAGLLFIAWAVASLFWTPAPLDAINALLVLFILGCCFCLGSQIENMRPVYIGAALGLSLSSVIAIAQWLGYHPLPKMTAISGLFVNGNFMAEAAALIVVALVAERIWWAVPMVLPALVLPLARGAMLACAVSLLLNFRHRREFWIVLAAVPLVAAAYIAAKGVDLSSVNDRFGIWQATLANVPMFGHGLGSFRFLFPSIDIRILASSSPEFTHNEFLFVAFELGVVGLALFLAFCLTLAGPLDTARLVLIALFVEMCLEFPTHLPTTGFVGLVAAGHAVRNRYVLRDFFVRGRRISGAGLA